ncbi:hypothetical protein [Catellatospora tritici]|uniref:hypothetical protein n=1 Tax=Catellatospora tritici TaxID=2851566 RepID=UPI001C2DB99C|nr:hypothetical protein [Catellatospora tritici]MBV1849437.1 hypothetical protein [Catellatospora tritici]MBV1854009.1 hypothetical protein [Catellatospora tritici]
MANEWNEIGDRLQGLGLKLKLHFEQSGPDAWPDALNKLGTAVEDLFKTTSNAVQDEAVRADVRDVGHLLADAVSNTLGKASQDIRGRFGSDARDSGGPEDKAPGTDPGTGTP